MIRPCLAAALIAGAACWVSADEPTKARVDPVEKPATRESSKDCVQRALLTTAEALRSLATMDHWWEGDRRASVLTPHAGEFGRLRAGSGHDPAADDRADPPHARCLAPLRHRREHLRPRLRRREHALHQAPLHQHRTRRASRWRGVDCDRRTRLEGNLVVATSGALTLNW